MAATDSKSPHETFDMIVIGSGLGGMTTAAILAKLNRKKVLVLERHFQLGGLTHEFQRGNFSWDVGVHYVGEMEPGNTSRRLFDYITDGKLEWQKMPYVFEKFVYPDFTFEVPSDPRDYQSKLQLLFPDEKRAIELYFRDIRRASALFRQRMVENMLPPFMAIGLRFWRRQEKTKMATLTLGQYLERRFKSERLKAVLASQWGDYGVRPKDASFAIHALIVNHYLRGGYFPVGGAASIAKCVRPVIEAAGGAVLQGVTVEQLIVRDGAAVGVRASYEDGPGLKRVMFCAPIVISAIGAVESFERLLRPLGVSACEDAPQIATTGLSAVTAYLGLSDSPESLGVRGENYWINGSYSHDDIDARSWELLQGTPTFCYVSFPSLKTPHPRSHTAEIIGFASYDHFQKFADKPWLCRAADYYELKERVSKGLVELADRTIPGLEKLVTYSELSTPLSVENFTSRSHGLMYGVPATAKRGARVWPRVSTPIRNFLLSGTDVTTVGIVGALMSGVATAAFLNGPFGLFKVMRAAQRSRSSPTRATDSAPIYGHIRANEQSVRLVSRSNLSSHFYELVLESVQPIAFVPGQHVYLEVTRGEWRPYSIASADGNTLTFVIDNNPGGAGSRFAAEAPIGAIAKLRSATGNLKVHDRNKNLVFVATGSGITPFLAMLRNLKMDPEQRQPITLLWGIRDESDDFSARYLGDDAAPRGLTVVPCVSDTGASERCYRGNVVARLRELAPDFASTDFYLCGNPRMISEVHSRLRKQGAAAIYFEM